MDFMEGFLAMKEISRNDFPALRSNTRHTAHVNNHAMPKQFLIIVE